MSLLCSSSISAPRLQHTESQFPCHLGGATLFGAAADVAVVIMPTLRNYTNYMAYVPFRFE
jgi:hypothetical protein